MSWLTVVALLFLVQAPPTGALEGVVLRAANGEPLSRTQVKLSRVLSEEERREFGKSMDPDDLAPTVFTDNDGRFAFKDIAAGSYRLIASRNGYSEQVYGRKVAEGPGATVRVLPGQTTRNVEFRLVQAGAVAGRVRDAFGEPVAGLGVRLMRVGYAFDGQKELQVLEEEGTDDRGEYRFFWIEPGRYYVRVGRSETFINKRIVKDRPVFRTYYPGTLDIENASMIEVRPGAELAGVDIVIPNIKGYTIRGRIVDGAKGKPPAGVNLQLAPKRQSVQSDDGQGERIDYESKTGAFEIYNVVPGAYWLFASAGTNFEEPLPGDTLSDIRTGLDLFKTVFSPTESATVAIDMPASDINNVVITLTKGATIPVHFSIDGQALSSVRNADKTVVSLFAANGREAQSSRMNADGDAKLDRVSPGQYRVFMGLEPDTDLFAKGVWYGRSDVLDSPMEVTDQAPAALTVLLSAKGGRIEGTLTDALSQPMKDTEVVLVPDRRERWELFKADRTDEKGHYSFKALPPGGYKLFAWEVLEPRSYHDPDVLSKYETQGRSLRIQESSKETIDLRIIPAPKQ
jgi:hypothetical protein